MVIHFDEGMLNLWYGVSVYLCLQSELYQVCGCLTLSSWEYPVKRKPLDEMVLTNTLQVSLQGQSVACSLSLSLSLSGRYGSVPFFNVRQSGDCSQHIALGDCVR